MLEGTELINVAKELKDYNNHDWLEKECNNVKINDIRLQKRYKNLLGQLWCSLGNPIPYACQDWANTKAAYRFLSNDEVTDSKILKGHFESTKLRVKSQKDGHILIIQDTTEFIYNRVNTEAIGWISKGYGGKDGLGKNKSYKRCGILMHSSLVVTSLGLPLGLCAIKFWTRKKFKGTNALRGKINATRIPIEEKESYRWLENLRQSDNLLQTPSRCVHIGDRESDIYELFCTAKNLGTHFLVRTCVDRLAGEGNVTMLRKLENADIKAYHNVIIREKGGKNIEVNLAIKYERIKICPPIGKHKKYPSLFVTIIHATETSLPTNRSPIIWKLMTDLDVNSIDDAIEKLDWYSLRWKIETFHKILKSGCRAESLKLRTAQRLTNLIAIFCIMSWRIFWMTSIKRCSPNLPVNLVFTTEEIKLISKLDINCKIKNNSVSCYITAVAKLGGYLDRNSDPPPGNMVIWRGMNRLADIAMGAKLAQKMTYG